jgi:hypothetical protein
MRLTNIKNILRILIKEIESSNSLHNQQRVQLLTKFEEIANILSQDKEQITESFDAKTNDKEESINKRSTIDSAKKPKLSSQEIENRIVKVTSPIQNYIDEVNNRIEKNRAFARAIKEHFDKQKLQMYLEQSKNWQSDTSSNTKN